MDVAVAKVTAESAKSIAAAEARAFKAETELAKAEATFDRQLLVDLRERLSRTDAGHTRGEVLRQEIESGLRYAMQQVGATESSILVRDPDPTSEYLFFLAAHGPAAPELRRMLVGPDSIAGRVFREGQADIVENPYRDSGFSRVVDERTEHITRDMMTIPLYSGASLVGVAQFLNPKEGRSFSDNDIKEAVSSTAVLALKVEVFVRDTDNFVQIGLYSPPSTGNAAAMFCDLSRSSSLFRVLHESGAVSCLNDYLSDMTDVVLRAGGSIDKYLGDGAMFHFVDGQAGSEMPGNLAVENALRASLAAMDSFKKIKQSWLNSRLEVPTVFSRIGIAYGPFRDALFGSTRYRTREVIGESFHRAATICDIAPRDRNAILVDEKIRFALSTPFEFMEYDPVMPAASRIDSRIFELIQRSS